MPYICKSNRSLICLIILNNKEAIINYKKANFQGLRDIMSHIIKKADIYIYMSTNHKQ